ncbi:uncharacterized protein J8A68_001215 [[Candida] subhashii]|uniref:Agglutinin-like protein N-terminal domain-containing protein n=1 Tax=[Candida] subhashii TaxID=561895 RepID=A0A8J5QG95_9ASCO|nr:uncharacterized protein J8A68_001215 [[Candida] subhashii]KAG7665159.1 hypothetical protein J8A68_001215 [[Candida] subhashii]
MQLKMIFKILWLFFVAACVQADLLHGIFYDFESIKWSKQGIYGFQAPMSHSWIVSLKWWLKSDAKAGDTFGLQLPCVYEFTAVQESLILNVGETVYATCNFVSGRTTADYSELKCTVVTSPQLFVYGVVSFPIVFNAGGSSSEIDTTCAQMYREGLNTIHFYDGYLIISTYVMFEATKVDMEGFYPNVRVDETAKIFQAFLLSDVCEDAYEVKFEFNIFANSFRSVCPIKFFLASSVNDWGYPKDVKQINDDDIEVGNCGEGAAVTLRITDTDYTPFMEVNLETTKPTIQTSATGYSFANTLTCKDGRTIKHSTVLSYAPYTSISASGHGRAVEFVSTITEKDISVTHPSIATYGSTDGTLSAFVLVPIPTITTTITWDSSFTETETSTAEPGGTAVVNILVPNPHNK